MIEFFKAKDCVGLFCIVLFGNYAFHFFPKEKQDRFWGRVDLSYGYDKDYSMIGFGPLLLVTWAEE